MAALVKYKYLGLSSVVEVDYPQAQVKLDLKGSTPGTYPGLDRFGRVVNHPWINYGVDPAEDVARIQHGYDRNSNRLWRQNDVARAFDKKFDQQYTYDGLNRLTDAKTGLLNGSHVIPSGGDTAFQQKWSLDYVGNWSCFKQDDDGGGTFDLDQTRTANPVNEITNISATTGPTWTTPQYDPAGNTTSFPKPADPTESFTAVYDAWNRMVKVIDNETDDIVQENVYDGRNFRIIKKAYDAGVLDETRHIYYTSNWQAIEERLGASPDSADPAQQYVWGIRYIDDLVLRDRDTSVPPDGTLNERLYALQDPNWNVTAIIDDTGDVRERYEYDAYGLVHFLDVGWAPATSSVLEWITLFGGYRFDINLFLYQVRHRRLHSTMGCWLEREPLAVKANYFINLFLYSHNNPVVYTDSTGELPEGVAGVPSTVSPRPPVTSTPIDVGEGQAPALLEYGNCCAFALIRFHLKVTGGQLPKRAYFGFELKAGSDSRHCCIVQFVKGARWDVDLKKYPPVQNFGREIPSNYPVWTVDTADGDPVYGSQSSGRGHKASTEEAGLPPNTFGSSDTPSQRTGHYVDLDFRTCVFDCLDVPHVGPINGADAIALMAKAVTCADWSIKAYYKRVLAEPLPDNWRKNVGAP